MNNILKVLTSKYPSDWVETGLGEISTIVTGRTPLTADQTNFGRDIPFVTPGDLGSKKYIQRSERGLTYRGATQSRLAPKNSILFVCIGSTIGKMGLSTSSVAFNQQINALICIPSVSPECVFYALSLVSPQIRQQASEQAVPLLNKKDFSSIKIYLPKLDEQKIIAESLADIDSLLEALDKLIAKKKDIKQGAMQQLLTDKTRLPGFSGEWESFHIGDLGTLRKGKGIRKDEVISVGIPSVRYGEIYTRYHNVIRNCFSFISDKVAKTSEPLAEGDIIFAVSGETSEDIGKCAAFMGNFKSYVGSDTVVLKPFGHDSIYLGYALNSLAVSSQKAKLGQGDAVVHLSTANLAQITVNLPSRDEQIAIAGVLSDMDAELEALVARREKTVLIKTGMMQELLTGRTRLL